GRQCAWTAAGGLGQMPGQDLFQAEPLQVLPYDRQRSNFQRFQFSVFEVVHVGCSLRFACAGFGGRPSSASPRRVCQSKPSRGSGKSFLRAILMTVPRRKSSRTELTSMAGQLLMGGLAQPSFPQNSVWTELLIHRMQARGDTARLDHVSRGRESVTKKRLRQANDRGSP